MYNTLITNTEVLIDPSSSTPLEGVVDSEITNVSFRNGKIFTDGNFIHTDSDGNLIAKPFSKTLAVADLDEDSQKLVSAVVAAVNVMHLDTRKTDGNYQTGGWIVKPDVESEV